MDTRHADNPSRADEPRRAAHERRTPLVARGEPMVWLMGSALVLSLMLIAGLIGVIAWRGAGTFWPRPIDRVELSTGEVFYGTPMRTESFSPSTFEAEEIESLRAAGELAEAAIDEDGLPLRRRYRVGNRDLGQQSFRWVPLHQIARTSRPAEATLLERRQWGVFFGELRAVLMQDEFTVAPDVELVLEETVSTQLGPARAEREILSTDADGVRTVRERRYLAESGAEAWPLFERMHAEALQRRRAIDNLNRSKIPTIQDAIASQRWAQRRAEIEHEETENATRDPWPFALWTLVALAALVAIAGAAHATRRAVRMPLGQRRRVAGAVAIGAWCVAGVATLAAAVERPGAGPGMTAERFARESARIEERLEALRAEQRSTLDRIAELEAADARFRVVFAEPWMDRISPSSQSRPDDPMPVSGVVRSVRANTLSTPERVRVYFSRWREFLLDEPRSNASEGGVYPVIVGTVTLTLLLTVSVVPLGVIAALYLREYARQGVVTSVIRIAINNLAGVPSIVYGMFGLGFFCYILGGFVDGGPAAVGGAMARPGWWSLVAVGALMITLAGALTLLAGRRPGADSTIARRALGILCMALWAGAIVLAFVLIATTPYFGGFFREKLPDEPTFGGRGILWASLTLALLTLPVVIVATEEAISAVPGSMREGSLATGASRWQTIRRIVLPAAMPGIMTGAILAMARGAGEVAPLMLVGAVHLAPALPVSSEFPFLHGDRTFMHLGFHIYNLGFQSPDSESTEPLVWTTTLLLISIVLVLNLTAVFIRARLRGASGSAAI